jgi:D-sedoheptulose 7-phosphate isomerase
MVAKIIGKFTLNKSQRISKYVFEVQTTLQTLPVGHIVEAADAIDSARTSGRRVFIFGNGGSAATAAHMACDLCKGAMVPGKPRIKAISLCDNAALLSAWANDTAYENIFAEQMENLIEEGDVAIGISASGNSLNVLKAIELAKARGATTIGFCGFDGGSIARLVDIPVVIRNCCIEQVEDLHSLLGHVITTYLKSHFEEQVVTTQRTNQTNREP